MKQEKYGKVNSHQVWFSKDASKVQKQRVFLCHNLPNSENDRKSLPAWYSQDLLSIIARCNVHIHTIHIGDQIVPPARHPWCTCSSQGPFPVALQSCRQIFIITWLPIASKFGTSWLRFRHSIKVLHRKDLKFWTKDRWISLDSTLDN